MHLGANCGHLGSELKSGESTVPPLRKASMHGPCRGNCSARPRTDQAPRLAGTPTSGTLDAAAHRRFRHAPSDKLRPPRLRVEVGRVDRAASPKSVDARSCPVFLLERDDADPDPVCRRGNGQRSPGGDDHDVACSQGSIVSTASRQVRRLTAVSSSSRTSVWATTARVVANRHRWSWAPLKYPPATWRARSGYGAPSRASTRFRVDCG